MTMNNQGAGLRKDQINALIGLYTQGRFQEALEKGVTLARQHPDAPFIPNLLGAIYTDLGQAEEAIASFQRALDISPENPVTHNNLGIALKRQARYEAALASFERALKLNPDYVEAHNNLGSALINLGRQEAAVSHLRRALELRPDYAEAHYNLGCAIKDLGQFKKAITSFQRALELKPDYVEAYNNLGSTLIELGQDEAAMNCFKRVLDLQPDFAEGHNNLGILLKRSGQNEAAIACFKRALELKPDYAVAHNNLGGTLNDLGQNEAAIACFRKALEIMPDYAGAYYNLGISLTESGQNEAAINCFQKAVRLDENNISARDKLVHELMHICDWDQVEEMIKGDVKSSGFGVVPKGVWSPFTILAIVDDADFQRRVAEAYVAANYRPNSALGPLSRLHKKGDKVRVGYFSADFYNHATMYLMAELFERHDRSRFEIHVFSFGPDINDGMHSRLVSSVDAYHDVKLMGNAEIATLSRSSGIDIAVDLKGHTKNSRTGIFAFGVAPIQVSYLGYPGTMGAPYIDYIIADRVIIPPEYSGFYTEKVVYMPDSYQVNDSARVISDKPVSRSDFKLPEQAFVFCCFNATYKITSDVFDVWMRLLNKVEGSVLWLLIRNQRVKQNLRNEALKRGCNPDRLIFAEHMPYPEHLARHRLADIFLDTFICNAHTTTSDALWAGLPVLTMMGESFASRVAGSLLNAIQIPELITITVQEYEDMALRLAKHPQELRLIHEKLQQNIRTASLFNAASFATHLESAYSQMIKRLEEGLAPEHLYC